MTERVFSVLGATATPATPISLVQAGLREREDLQEWVIAHPEILGAGVLLVATEFDRWTNRGGTRERDRLDLLGIGSDGRLVVGELKRDRAPDTVEMQAIKYASLASRFSEDTLVESFARFLTRDGQSADEEAARQRIVEHAGELDIETLRRPRIVLVAGSFTPVVTASVVWLTEMGLDITLQQVHAYRVDEDQTIITVSQQFPIPEVEDFTVSPQRAQLKAAEERRSRSRETNTVVQLVNNDDLADGTPLNLRPSTDVGPEVRKSVEEWVGEDPRRGQARWHNDARRPLEWLIDGNRYSPTELARRIVREATGGVERSLHGPRWWVVNDGRDLPTVAGIRTGGRFDWGQLHEVLKQIPPGQWTTYGDLAEIVGTAAVPLGQHVASCPDCPNAYRVLGSDGRPRENFRWDDPRDTRSQEDILQAEGVRFQEGRADPEQRVNLTARG